MLGSKVFQSSPKRSSRAMTLSFHLATSAPPTVKYDTIAPTPISTRNPTPFALAMDSSPPSTDLQLELGGHFPLLLIGAIQQDARLRPHQVDPAQHLAD